MTAPAGHQGMQLMGDLLVVVREVALAAVAVDVLAVAGLHCLRMAVGARDFWVRCLPIRPGVNERDFFPGQGLSRRPELGMAVQADALDLFGCHAFFKLNPPVAGHARLVLRRQRREFFLFLVAGAALLVPRLGRIEGDIFFDRSLIMGVVAGQTHLMFFRVLDLLRTVLPFLETGHDLFVANQAVVRLKKILGAFSYFLRVGMKRFLLRVIMAVPARCLTVD